MYITIKFKRDEGITKESIKVGDCFAGHHKSIYFQGIYKMTVLEINRARVKMKSQLMFVEDGGEFWKLQGHYRREYNRKENILDGRIYKGKFTYGSTIYNLIPFNKLPLYME